MAFPGKRVPWRLTVVLVFFALLSLACQLLCNVWEISVAISTDEYLVIEASGQDTADELPVLMVLVRHSDGFELTYDVPLVPIEDHGFTLDREYDLSARGFDSKNAVTPETFTLVFDLARGEAEETGGRQFPTIEVTGNDPVAELWGGWTLQLQWDEDPAALCR